MQTKSTLPVQFVLRFLKVIVAVFFLSCWSFSSTSSAAFDLSTVSDEIIKVNDSGLIIQWSADVINWDSNALGSIPTIDQFSTESRPGFPQLPYRTATFAIPAGAIIQTKLVTGRALEIQNDYSVAVAPQPSGVQANEDGEAVGGRYQPAELEPTAKRAIKTIIVEEIGTMGGIRLGKATFYPLAYQKGQLVFTQQATVEITFATNPAIRSPKIETPTNLETSLHALVVNPAHLERSRSERSQRLAEMQSTSAVATIWVEKEGMVWLTQQDLVDQHINPETLNPNRLQISYLGQALSFRWMGDHDDQFEAGEGIIFYAPPAQSRWSESAPFLLSNEVAESSWMEVMSENISTQLPLKQNRIRTLVEENRVYTPECICGKLPTGWDGDRWVWKELRRPGNPTTTIEAHLENIDNNFEAEMTIWMIGFTNQQAKLDHEVAVNLNGTLVGTLLWDGRTAHSITFQLPAGLLQQSNQIELELVDSEAPNVPIDGVWLDAIEFNYVYANSEPVEQIILENIISAASYQLPLATLDEIEIYDISDPLRPIYLSNAIRTAGKVLWQDVENGDANFAIVPLNKYLKPKSIVPSKGTSIKADAGVTYIIIAPNEFIESGELERLKSLRHGQGWVVGIESVEEIYTAFGDGDLRPEAIRDYLAWGYHEWDILPEMVLLVGDGSSDPKLHRSATSPTRIPAFLANVDPWFGETAADNRFVTLDGADHLPDLAIGRLPVNSVDELRGVIDKIVDYESADKGAGWNQHQILVADNTDSAGAFSTYLNILIDRFLKHTWRSKQVYLDSARSNLVPIQNEILENWRNGLGLVIYEGHSSRHQWGSERLFHLEDVGALQNNRHLPLVIQLTCLTSAFHTSSLDNTLDEQLVRQLDGGAIATWGSTGLGVSTGHHWLASGTLDSIYVQMNPTLGTALLAGKLKLAANSQRDLELLDTFTLLGDPALQLNLDLTPAPILLPLVSN